MPGSVLLAAEDIVRVGEEPRITGVDGPAPEPKVVAARALEGDLDTRVQGGVEGGSEC